MHSSPATIKKLDYYVCGRHAGVWALAFSLLASCIGGTATIGMIGLAFRCGWPAFWWLGSGAIGLLLLGLFLAKKVRATRAATLPEIIQMRLGSKCRVFASVMILLSSIAVVGAQFNALGLILASLLPIKFGVATLLGALSVFVYTFIGGQRAVIHSDRWQFLVFLSSLGLVLLFLLSRPECLAALRHTPAELYNDRLPLQRIIYFLLVFGSSFVIGPMIFGRLLSAKSPMLARKGTLRAALGLALMALLIVAIGIAMTGLDLAVAEQDNALFDSLKGGLPPWLGLYISIGLLCAIISSADSCLLTASFVWASGLRRKGDIPTARKAMLVLTLMACAIVFTDKGILGLLLAASDIYVGGIICPVLLALLSARQHDNNLMLCAMLAGGVCGVGAALTANANWSFTGMALSLLIAGLAFAVKCGKNQG